MPRVRPEGEGVVRHLGRPHGARAQSPPARPRQLTLRRKLLVLSRPTAPEQPDTGTLEIRRASADDAAAFARDIATYPEPAFAARLTDDVHCYLAFDDGHIVHSSWCSSVATWTEELQTYLAPPTGDAYVYESFTVEAARGRGIYPVVLRAISADLRREGVRRIWIGVEPTNEASIRAISKAGFHLAYSFVAEMEGSTVTVRTDLALDESDSLHTVSQPARDGPSGG